jgi:hypothetical protein
LLSLADIGQNAGEKRAKSVVEVFQTMNFQGSGADIWDINM